MRIVFFGGAEFARPSLDAVAHGGFDIAGVVVPREKPQGRGLKPEPGPVKARALESGLPVFEPEDPHRPEFADEMKKLGPELFIVIAYGYILRPHLLAVPARGSVGVHPSLLPRFRGAAPIQRAIIAGETKTGVTTFFLDARVDTGSIILQEETPIGSEETYGELSARLADLGSRMLVETVRSIASGTVQPSFQDDRWASPAPKIGKEEWRIDWSKPATEIVNLIRALSPLPGAYTFFRGKRMEIYRARAREACVAEPGSAATDAQGLGEPGEMFARAKNLIVAAGEASLEILELKPEGKKMMAGVDFINGYRPQPGEKFGS